MEDQPTIAVTKTYSLTLMHIAMVSDLAKRMNVSQGEVVRRAIEMLYDKSENSQDTQPPTAA